MEKSLLKSTAFSLILTIFCSLTQSVQALFDDYNYEESDTGRINFKYSLLFVGSIVIIAVVRCLREEYYELSTGEVYNKVRNVRYAEKISRDEFERQKKDFTDKEVDKLLKSPLYKQKMTQLSAEKENRYVNGSRYEYSSLQRTQLFKNMR